MASFLSEEWFSEVDRIRAEHGHEDAGDLLINVVVLGGPDGDIEMHTLGGKMEKGLSADAPTTLKLPFAVAYSMFITGDQAAATQAFMSGQIQIEGDMSKLMAMQGQPQPPAEMTEAIKAMTDPVE